jgi:hypothetical protein
VCCYEANSDTSYPSRTRAGEFCIVWYRGEVSHSDPPPVRIRPLCHVRRLSALGYDGRRDID